MFRKARNSQNQNRDLFTKINYDLVLTCKDFNTTYLIILLLMATAEKCQVQPSCPFLILIINDFSLGESPVEGTQGSPSFPSAPLLLMNKPFSRDRLLERSSWLPEGRRVQSWRPRDSRRRPRAVSLRCALGWTALSAFARMITQVFRVTVSLACQMMYALYTANEEPPFGRIPVMVVFFKCPLVSYNSTFLIPSCLICMILFSIRSWFPDFHLLLRTGS